MMLHNVGFQATVVPEAGAGFPALDFLDRRLVVPHWATKTGLWKASSQSWLGAPLGGANPMLSSILLNPGFSVNMIPADAVDMERPKQLVLTIADRLHMLNLVNPRVDTLVEETAPRDSTSAMPLYQYLISCHRSVSSEWVDKSILLGTSFQTTLSLLQDNIDHITRIEYQLEHMVIADTSSVFMVFTMTASCDSGHVISHFPVVTHCTQREQEQFLFASNSVVDTWVTANTLIGWDYDRASLILTIANMRSPVLPVRYSQQPKSYLGPRQSGMRDKFIVEHIFNNVFDRECIGYLQPNRNGLTTY